MSRRYFGTDGIRGLVGEAPITPDFMVRLGFAAGEVLVRHAGAQRQEKAGVRPAVLIGKDTRISGYMLEASLEAGFAAAGVDVMLTGPMPTPAIAYLTRALRLQAGVVISASHNPYPDNGIKFFSADGNKLPDAVEAEIEAQLALPMRCRPSAQLGKARRVDDAAGRYLEFCKSTFPNVFDLRRLKIVVDCANGAAYHIAPHVLHELGAEVVTVGVSPDGFNINDQVGASHPQSLQTAVKQHNATFGIALDGDADRLLMVDANGRTYDGDQLLYIIARMRAKQGALPGVVGTLMSNLALERALDKLGVAFARAKVGDRYVLELMQEKGWQLGGENSGHIICLDKHTTGDGLVSALQVLTAICETDRTLGELSRDLILYPQKLVNVKVSKGFKWEANKAVGKAKEAAERELGKTGRVLLRPSGTEPVLRVMVEGEDGAKVEALAAMLAESVRAAALT
jgi:phosphoglucosamine mutase